MVAVREWTGREAGLLRAALRLSSRDFAARLGVDLRTVTRWQARGAAVTLRPHMQAVLDTALRQASDEAKSRFAAFLTQDASNPTSRARPARPVRPREEPESREVLDRDLGYAPQPAGLEAAPGGLRAAPARPSPGRRGRPSGITAALVQAMLTTGGHGSAVEPMPVDDLTRLSARAWRLRQAARYEALGQLLPSLLVGGEASIAVLGGVDQQRGVCAVVHAYNAASSLLRRLGDAQLALVAADRARRVAADIDDPVLVAAAMYRLANVLLSDNRLDDAKAVALQAADLTSPSQRSPRRGIALWGGLLLTAAVAAARAHARSEAWELIGQARIGAGLLGNDHADIYAIFGPTNVAIHGVQVAVELGDGRDAVRRSHAVNADRLPAGLRERRGQFLIDLAHGHVLEKNDTEAVATLLRAEQIAAEEVRFSGQVRQLTTTMLSRERAGAVAGLRRLASVVGVTG